MSQTSVFNPTQLTSGRVLSQNALWNLIGQGAPIPVSLVAIPLIIRGLGSDRFGLLTLAWAFIGYFSIFDFGLGRALTLIVADRLGAGREREIPTIVWVSLLLMSLLGIGGAVVGVLLSPWLVRDLLRIPDQLQLETLDSFYALAICIPIVILSTGLRGILEAYQRFDLTNIVRICVAVFMYLGPVLVLVFSNSLLLVVASLGATRLVALLPYLAFCLRVMPDHGSGFGLDATLIKPLLQFGSWMTVSNIIGPLMTYLDRFLIGGIISVSAVGYYTTPYQIATQLLIIPGAVVGVLFPAFATALVQDQSRSEMLFDRGIKYLYLATFPLVLTIIAFAHDFFLVWLGSEFAQQSTSVLQWLAVGVFINGFALMPFTLVQSAGRPDLTAKLHLIELPFYLSALWWLTRTLGIDGTAIAWAGRSTLDAALLFAVAQRYLPNDRSMNRRIAFALGVMCVTFVFAALLTSILVKTLFLLLALLGFAVTAWALVLDSSERALLQSSIKHAPSSLRHRFTRAYRQS